MTENASTARTADQPHRLTEKQLAIDRWHQEFLTYVLPAVQLIAQLRFRDLPEAEREEATAEAVAGALVTFLRLLQRGKAPTAFAGRLARYAVMRVLAGRLTSCSDNCQDAMSRLATRTTGIQCRKHRHGSQAKPPRLGGHLGRRWAMHACRNRHVPPRFRRMAQPHDSTAQANRRGIGRRIPNGRSGGTLPCHLRPDQPDAARVREILAEIPTGRSPTRCRAAADGGVTACCSHSMGEDDYV